MPGNRNQSGRVIVRMGDIFEGGMDLTVLPCSAKKTISSAARRWVDLFGLTPPADIPEDIVLGKVSSPKKFPGPSAKTRNYVWAASVFNDATTPEAIEGIGQRLGQISLKFTDIRNIETPLLGSGAGRLNDQIALKSIAKGFVGNSAPESTLCIFVFGSERFSTLNESLAEGLWGTMWEALQLKPGMFGISFDIKKLLGKPKSRD